MICEKCGKEMDRADGGMTITGIKVDVSILPKDRTLENVNYYNEQLGKYSDGYGECHRGICYECYIDALLSHGNVPIGVRDDV